MVVHVLRRWPPCLLLPVGKEDMYLCCNVQIVYCNVELFVVKYSL